VSNAAHVGGATSKVACPASMPARLVLRVLVGVLAVIGVIGVIGI